MECGVVERHLEMAQPTKKPFHLENQADLISDVGPKVAVEVVHVDRLHRCRQDLLSIFFDDGSDVPEKRLHPEVYIVNSLSRSKFE